LNVDSSVGFIAYVFREDTNLDFDIISKLLLLIKL